MRLVKCIPIVISCGLRTPHHLQPVATTQPPPAAAQRICSPLGIAPCGAGLWEGLSPCQRLHPHAAARSGSRPSARTSAQPAPSGQLPAETRAEPTQETGRNTTAGTRRAWTGTRARCRAAFPLPRRRPGEPGAQPDPEPAKPRPQGSAGTAPARPGPRCRGECPPPGPAETQLRGTSLPGTAHLAAAGGMPGNARPPHTCRAPRAPSLPGRRSSGRTCWRSGPTGLPRRCRMQERSGLGDPGLGRAGMS